MARSKRNRWQSINISGSKDEQDLLDRVADAGGVFILYFNDGSEFVGLSSRLAVRLGNLLAEWPTPIKRIDFFAGEQTARNKVYRRMLRAKRATGAALRNLGSGIDGNGFRAGSESSSSVAKLPVGELERASIELRKQLALNRSSGSERESFSALVDEVLDLLALYVAFVLPVSVATEAESWVLSARKLARRAQLMPSISVNGVDVLQLQSVRSAAGAPGVLWGMAAGVGSFARPAPTFEEFDGSGREFHRMYGLGVSGLVELFRHPESLAAVQEFAREQQRLGPELRGVAHDRFLADEVYLRASDWVARLAAD